MFGNHVYIHVLEEKRTKLQPSSLKDVFVGYKEISKALPILYSISKEDIDKSICEA